jgi:predicted membrane protein
MQSRVDRMFGRDRLWAWGFVIALWIVLAFVYFAVSGVIVDGTAKMVAAIAAVLVGVFNTASIAAMISHYGHDKNAIYELDIKHLDANR